MELAEIIAFLEETPEAVRRMSEGVGAEELRERADDAGFSFVEHACHLRDIEREGYAARIERILSEELPALADINGRRLAAERRYNEQRFEDGLEEFAEARGHNTAVLRGATEEQLRRRGLFGDAGEVTLARMASMMYEHDAEHLEELRALRAQLLKRRSAGA
jgi:hypothetical protein